MNWADDEVFRQTTEGLLVRRGVESALGAVDTVIFDIDGVLVDATGSFRYVICDAVQFYFERVLGVEGSARLLQPEDTHHFKMAGGFNSDWDLTEAAIVFFLWKMHTHRLSSLEEIQGSRPSVRELTGGVSTTGGGLKSVYAWVAARLPKEEMPRVVQQADRALIRGIFQEHYAGDQYCRRLYGFSPRYYHGPGRIHNERMILDRSVWRPELFSYGILSGRTPEEIDLALELLGIRVPWGVIVGDDEVHPAKPDPWGLAELAGTLNTRAGVYVGDTWDDLRTVLHYRARADEPPMLFCYCLTDYADEKTLNVFKAEGADIIARDVNVFLRHLLACSQAAPQKPLAGGVQRRPCSMGVL